MSEPLGWWVCFFCGQAFKTADPTKERCSGSRVATHDPAIPDVLVDAASIRDIDETGLRGYIIPPTTRVHRAECPEHPGAHRPILTGPDGERTLYCGMCPKHYPLCTAVYAADNLPCMLHAGHDGVHGHGALEWR